MMRSYRVGGAGDTLAPSARKYKNRSRRRAEQSDSHGVLWCLDKKTKIEKTNMSYSLFVTLVTNPSLTRSSDVTSALPTEHDFVSRGKSNFAPAPVSDCGELFDLQLTNLSPAPGRAPDVTSTSSSRRLVFARAMSN